MFDDLMDRILAALDQLDVQVRGVDIDWRHDYPRCITVRYEGSVGEAVVFNHLNHDAYGRSVRPAGCELIVTQVRYPLYCVDRGRHGSDECPYYGPFATHDQALAHLNPAEPDAHIRHCRRVKPSEIRYGANDALRDLAEEDHQDPFDWLVDELDQAAHSGELPDVAWYDWTDTVVHGGEDDGTLPTADNWAAWLDSHMTCDAYICEGDE